MAFFVSNIWLFFASVAFGSAGVLFFVDRKSAAPMALVSIAAAGIGVLVKMAGTP